MILQLRQIFFTDASTFISFSKPSFHRGLEAAPPEWPAPVIPAYRLPVPVPYFARNVIRARERSYGETSTVTLSPGSILM